MDRFGIEVSLGQMIGDTSRSTNDDSRMIA